MNKSNTKKKSGFKNPVQIAMQLRYGKTTSTHKDRRLRRQTKQSWRKEEY